MIRIAISPEAFAAICDTLPPGGVAFEHDRDDQGRVLVWLDHRTVDRLTAQRRTGESYSDCHPAAGGGRAHLMREQP